MSEKHFEAFLVSNLRGWLQSRIETGARYQFKSPDPENTNALVSELLTRSDGQLRYGEHELSYLEVNDVRLLVAGHLEQPDIENGCYTENYISNLRDTVAAQMPPFASCALLIVHNSLLDTLINSAFDLAQGDAVWSPRQTKNALDLMISGGLQNQVASRCLLEHQARLITEEGSSVFGFRHLHDALLNGDLRFQELGLFNDPQVLSNSSEKQVARRLESNRQLREEIEFAVEHFPNDLEDKLTKFGSKFIQEHFGEGAEVPWTELNYQAFRDEEELQKKLTLDYEGIEVKGCEIDVRDKKDTSAGRRDKHLIIEVPSGQDMFNFKIKFVGQRLDKKELLVTPKAMSDVIDIDFSFRGDKSIFTISGPYRGEPEFFSLRLNRDASNEKYSFSCLVVQNGVFHLSAFENRFLIDRKRKALVLQADQHCLDVNPELITETVLSDSDETVDVNSVGKINFEQLYDESDEVNFTLTNENRSLFVLVEGEPSKEALRLPVIFDSSRFARLFKDDNFNGVYRPGKGTVVFDSQESEPVFFRKALLQAESAFVNEECIEWDNDRRKGTPLSSLSLSDDRVYQAYLALITYFQEHKTLPSLASWGPELVELGKEYVLACVDYLEHIQTGKPLDSSERLVICTGLAIVEERQFFTPFHPLVMAYYLSLVEEIVEDGEARSFRVLPEVTKGRLNARGLLPHLFDRDSRYSYTQAVPENPLWLEVVPHQDTSFDFVVNLVKHKIEEFTSTFEQLFRQVDDAPLLINSVNNAENSELFRGLVSYYQANLLGGRHIHVNLYDEKLIETEFDVFAEMGMYDEIKERYGLHKGAARRNSDAVIDLLRTRLTFSKFQHNHVEKQAYAHLTFFKNDQKVEAVDNNIDEHVSGVACSGLLSGESSRSEGDRYFTAFGLKGVDYNSLPHLKLAKLIGTLWRPSQSKNDVYHDHSATSLAVSQEFMSLLERSYDSSVWTTIIDPKVTLKFFEATEGVILIHYSDQYTSSSGYDAITVTKQVDLYKNVLGNAGNELIREFNAFNGEWLLRLITDHSKEKIAKEGIIGAYKIVSVLLAESDITWIPISVAEMIRVAGNIGLAMTDSDFSRHNRKIKKGAISDDILFAGFKEGQLYLLPVEVKAGGRPDFSKAREQALELKRYMEEDLLGPDTLASRLYRGLFIRQVLLQIEKYQLYQVFEDGHFADFFNHREEWLEGQYGIGQLPNYPSAMVVAHINNESCFEEKYELTEGVLQAEIPMGLLDELVRTPYQELKVKIENSSLLHVPKEYFLQPFTEQELADVKEDVEHDGGVFPAAPDDSSEEKIGNSEPAIPTEPLRIQFGKDVQSGEVIYWEPTNTEKLFNTNTGIIGTMGTGKTQFTKSLITQLVRNQSHNVDGAPIGILIFDYKADYVKDEFVEATNAKVYDLFHLPFNPFAVFGNRPMQPMHTANLFRTTVAKAFGLGPKQQNKVRTLVMDAYEVAGIYPEDPSTWGRPAPTLADIWAEFQAQEKVEQDSLYAALDDLIGFKIFEPDTNKTQSLYDLVDGVTVINLSGYDPSIQNLVVALTLDLFYTQMHQQGSSKLDGNFRQISKMILVDEADNFMSQDFDSLKKILKEGREFGVGTILSTQELTHFKTGDNDYSTLILSWVIHQVANIKSQEIKAIFNTQSKQDEEYFMMQIRKLPKHHSLCIDGKKKVTKVKDLAFWELK
ncbi:DNA phosphorothioation-dependent restriction protein DptH [Halomonas sp. 707B3]|uniref:DNA phosphorothioation-dependent restriction protein DptH n=1 Tax=Halomonas sp. 707B3 TaxID=1681043 RepID=UPI00209FA5CC|nr:DNA phosphorothioation-dependent restriction protein DptH [Halomonas sp. 707B3]MCP1318067.1 DNA phosphorothioation-dependent restriction protein DptH [Halomonas sp. 707B3]